MTYIEYLLTITVSALIGGSAGVIVAIIITLIGLVVVTILLFPAVFNKFKEDYPEVGSVFSFMFKIVFLLPALFMAVAFSHYIADRLGLI